MAANSVSFTVTRKLANTKFRYEKAHKRHFCSTHPDSSSSFCAEGGEDVNINRWCPAPYGHETHRWILFSPPLTSPLQNVRGWKGDESENTETGPLVSPLGDRGEGPTAPEDLKEGRRERSRGQDAEWGRWTEELEFLFFYFCGSTDFK